MPELNADITIIGGGPAGYTAALRASKLGGKVVLVEKRALGGACLNNACIPTKTLLHSLSLLRSINNAGAFGIDADRAGIDFAGLREYKNKVVSLISGGVQQLMKQNGVIIVSGSASFLNPTRIEILQDNGNIQFINSTSAIIATGSVPRKLNIPGFEAPHVLYSSDILKINHIPDTLTIVGGGAVGVELASIMNGLGARVSILEVMPRILSGEDQETALVFEQGLRKSGIKIYAETEIVSLETPGDLKRIRFKRGNSEEVLESESVCVAAGQQPFFDGLGLAACGVKSSSRGIDVDKHMRTSAPGILAAGDVTGNLMLAYVAMAEGRVAAENASGRDTVIDYAAVPHCVYGSPIELASVGITENQAIKDALKVKVFRSGMGANASAAILGERRGMVKILAGENGKILGVHMAGTGVSNLIAECALAMKLGAGINDLEQTLHPHPTLSESIWDAALNDNS